MTGTITRIAVVAVALAAVLVLPTRAQEILPRPEPPFEGTIGRSAADSTPDFPAEVRAPEGAPNVLLIMTDDVGFGASSTFGGPIPTPTFDELAADGLQYTRFHTTALCSPTRAALITGRNHHSVATGAVMEMGTGYPGYHTLMPKSAGTVAQVLTGNGYSTSWFGKNHNVPDWHKGVAGPFDLWPTGLGFEYFYGFIGGDANQWRTALFEGTVPIEAEEQSGPDPKHLDELLADKAIDWIRTQHAIAPDKPFFRVLLARHGALSALRAEGLDRQVRGPVRPGCARHGDPTTDSMNIRPVIPRASDHPLQQHPTGMI